MKAVIADTRGLYAAALTQDGTVERVRNRGYKVGQVVKLRKLDWRKRAALRVLTTAAVLAVCFAGANVYMTPYSHLTLAVNPTIVFTLNRIDVVLNVEPGNVEAKIIAEQLNARFLPYESVDNAVSRACSLLVDEGYFKKGQETDVYASTDATEGKALVLLDKVKTAIVACVGDENVRVRVEIEPEKSNTPNSTPVLTMPVEDSPTPIPTYTPTIGLTQLSTPIPTPSPTPYIALKTTPTPTSIATISAEDGTDDAQRSDNGNHYGQQKPQKTPKPKRTPKPNKKKN